MADLERLLQQELSKLLSVTRMTVNRWQKAGMPKNADGTYRGSACIAWLITRMEDRVEKQAEAGCESEESLRWLGEFRKQRALIATVERKRLEGEFVPVAEVTEENVKKISAVVNALRNLPVRIAPQLCGLTDRYEIADVIELETSALQEVLAAGKWYSVEAVEAIIAKMGGMGPGQAMAKKIEAQRTMPGYMIYDPRRKVFTDERDGTEVPASEANEYVRAYPYLHFKTRKQAVVTNVPKPTESNSGEKKR